MERRARAQLTRILEVYYELRRPSFVRVKIFWTRKKKGPSYHDSMEAYELVGGGPLSGRFVIRSPNHPARMFNSDDAHRIARAIRQVLVCLAERRESITLIYDET
jgi:hypothetical protein